jgi:hypothetical protein
MQSPVTDEPTSPSSPRAKHPGMSRTPSTATVTQSRIFSGGSRRPSQTYSKGLLISKRPDLEQGYPEAEDPDLGRDGASESESENDTAQRTTIRRSPLSKRPPLRTLSSDGDADDDDDEDSGGFLPFAAKSIDPEPAATLRNPISAQSQNTSRTPQPSSSRFKDQPPSSDEASSATSSQQPSEIPSQQRRTQASTVSPRYKSAVSGSEGSPSVGSSFSDLDVSVTQSALEDALLSHVQHGGSIGMGLGSLVRGRGNGNTQG